MVVFVASGAPGNAVRQILNAAAVASVRANRVRRTFAHNSALHRNWSPNLLGPECVTISRAAPAGELGAVSRLRDRLMNPPGVEFSYGSEPVGRFTDPSPPDTDGAYRYEPFRGPGHLHMQEALKQASVSCSYAFHGVTVSFRVVACPSYGVLQLTSFMASNEQPKVTAS